MRTLQLNSTITKYDVNIKHAMVVALSNPIISCNAGAKSEVQMNAKDGDMSGIAEKVDMSCRAGGRLLTQHRTTTGGGEHAFISGVNDVDHDEGCSDINPVTVIFLVGSCSSLL